MYRAVTTIVIAGMCFGVSMAQDGVLGNVDAEAESYLVEFAAARNDLPNGILVVGRGKADGTSNQQGMELSFIESLFVRVGGSTKRLSAFSIRRAPEKFRAEDSWEQSLTVDGKVYRRHGSPYRTAAVEHSEKEGVSLADSVTRRMTPTFDPFYLSVADVGSFLKSEVDSSYGLKLMRGAKFFSARRNKDGMIEGIWKLGETNPNELILVFDEKQGQRPVTAIWSSKTNGRSEIFTVVKTRWHRLNLGGKEEVWVPLEIRRANIFSGGRKQSEYVFRMEWRGIKEGVFPDPKDEDWREPYTQLIGIDWYQPFADYLPYGSDTSSR